MIDNIFNITFRKWSASLIPKMLPLPVLVFDLAKAAFANPIRSIPSNWSKKEEMSPVLMTC